MMIVAQPVSEEHQDDSSRYKVENFAGDSESVLDYGRKKSYELQYQQK